jgi:hypothetical protein
MRRRIAFERCGRKGRAISFDAAGSDLNVECLDLTPSPHPVRPH